MHYIKNYREERAILILCPNRLSQNPFCQFLKKNVFPKTQTLKDLKPPVQEKCPQKVIILEKLEYLERRFVYQSFPGPHPVWQIQANLPVAIRAAKIIVQNMFNLASSRSR